MASKPINDRLTIKRCSLIGTRVEIFKTSHLTGKGFMATSWLNCLEDWAVRLVRLRPPPGGGSSPISETGFSLFDVCFWTLSWSALLPSIEIYVSDITQIIWLIKLFISAPNLHKQQLRAHWSIHGVCLLLGELVEPKI